MKPLSVMTAFSENSGTNSHGNHTPVLQYHHQGQSEIYAFRSGDEGIRGTGSKGREKTGHAQRPGVEMWRGDRESRA